MKVEYLSYDQFGNYVIQNIIDKVPSEQCFIYDKIKGKVLDFSFHKCASNVIEKCLDRGSVNQVENIIQEVLQLDDFQDGKVIVNLATSKFGNYVLQKMIESSTGETQKKLIKRIKKYSTINKDCFAWHVLNMINNLEIKNDSLNKI